MKKIIEKLVCPLLFYADSKGNYVFRSFKSYGLLYNIELTKQQVGTALEYRFDLNKKFNLVNFLLIITCYLFLLTFDLSVKTLIFVLVLYFAGIILCRESLNQFYTDYLLRTFGKYVITEFNPNLTNKKFFNYVYDFSTKIIFLLLVIFVLSLGAKGLVNRAEKDINQQKFEKAEKTINLYSKIYPKTNKLYDLRAIIRYSQKDYKGAIADYKRILKNSSSKIRQNDFVRFANILILEKKLTNATNAIDLFNEYITKKKLSVVEYSQFLWIKSMFSIENNITENIIADYDNLIDSLDEKDTKNRFYVLSDKAYILYIMRDYKEAIQIYNELIEYAKNNNMKELNTLYVERAFAKMRTRDALGADKDFAKSGLPDDELISLEPALIVGKFSMTAF